MNVQAQSARNIMKSVANTLNGMLENQSGLDISGLDPEHEIEHKILEHLAFSDPADVINYFSDHEVPLEPLEMFALVSHAIEKAKRRNYINQETAIELSKRLAISFLVTTNKE